MLNSNRYSIYTWLCQHENTVPELFLCGQCQVLCSVRILGLGSSWVRTLLAHQLCQLLFLCEKGMGGPHLPQRAGGIQARWAWVLLIICDVPLPFCFLRTDSARQGDRGPPKTASSPTTHQAPRSAVPIVHEADKQLLSLLKSSLLCCHGYDDLFLNSFFSLAA